MFDCCFSSSILWSHLCVGCTKKFGALERQRCSLWLYFNCVIFCYCSQSQLELFVNTHGPEEEVSELVELIWKEAMGELEDVLSVSIDNITVEQVRSDNGETFIPCEQNYSDPT